MYWHNASQNYVWTGTVLFLNFHCHGSVCGPALHDLYEAHATCNSPHEFVNIQTGYILFN